MMYKRKHNRNLQLVRLLIDEALAGHLRSRLALELLHDEGEKPLFTAFLSYYLVAFSETLAALKGVLLHHRDPLSQKKALQSIRFPKTTTSDDIHSLVLLDADHYLKEVYEKLSAVIHTELQKVECKKGERVQWLAWCAKDIETHNYNNSLSLSEPPLVLDEFWLMKNL